MRSGWMGGSCGVKTSLHLWYHYICIMDRVKNTSAWKIRGMRSRSPQIKKYVYIKKGITTKPGMATQVSPGLHLYWHHLHCIGGATKRHNFRSCWRRVTSTANLQACFREGSSVGQAGSHDSYVMYLSTCPCELSERDQAWSSSKIQKISPLELSLL